MKYAFFDGRGFVAVFLAEVESANASPHIFFLAFDRPRASAVRGFTFSADEQFGQRVLA